VGTAHYRGEFGKSYITSLLPASSANLIPQDSNFWYFGQSTTGGDPNVRAWAFAKYPTCGCEFAVWKLKAGGWEFYDCDCRDVTQ
jgi:hypothetical protein